MARLTSKKYSINWRDSIVSLGIAVGTPVLLKLQEQLAGGDFVFNWKGLAAAGISAGLAYLIKKFFDPQQKIEVVKKDDEINR